LHGQNTNLEQHRQWFWFFFFLWLISLTWPGPPPCRGFEITVGRNTLGRVPLDEWSACRRDLYLKTQDNHKRQTSLTPRDSNPQSQQASDRRPTP